MDYKDMFDSKLVDLNIESVNCESLFQEVANHLSEQGYVCDNYIDGILSREKEFPTGLITQYLNIALPHSDPKYINKPFVYIARTNNDITVSQMGDSQIMKCQNFFFLGIKNPTEQVGLLQKFMELFMDSNFVEKYKHVDNPNDAYNLFINNI